MSYFLPSFLQKRILRYALSRLELLDTDTLDLDQLDIEWGKTSTVEIREVAIRTQKLATLLQLPTALAIVSAQILFLRLTVPADLYNSSILVEVDGVKVRVQDNSYLEPGYPQRTARKRNKRHQDGGSAGPKVDLPRSRQSQVHDPGGTRTESTSSATESHDGSRSDELPTTVDLAKSFLQYEANEEKQDIRAAVAKSQHLDKSQISIDDQGDAPALGIGDTYSVPAFLADFLRGVADRIQIKIRDLEIDLILKVERPIDQSSSSHALPRRETVTIRLAVEKAGIDRVSGADKKVEELENCSTDAEACVQGVRCITLNNLELMLVSETSVFANFGHATGPSSPRATHLSPVVRFGNSPGSSPPSTSNTLPGVDRPVATANVNSTAPDSPDSDYHSQQAIYGRFTDIQPSRDQATRRVPLYASNSETNLNERLVTNLYDGDTGTEQDLKMPPEHSDTLFDSPIYGASSGYNKSIRNKTQPNRRYGERDSSGKGRTNTARQEVVQISENAPNPHVQQNLRADRAESLTDDIPLASQSASSSFSLSSEDLTQSKIFTHKEASMYMSAISHNSRDGIDGEHTTSEDSSSSNLQGGESADVVSNGTSPTIPPSHGVPPDSASTRPQHVPAFDELSDEHEDRDLSPSASQWASDRHVSSDSSPEEASEAYLPSATSDKEESSSYQGSETSSTNLKSSFAMMKQIIRVDEVSLTVFLGSMSPNKLTETQGQRSDREQARMPGQFTQLSESALIDSEVLESGSSKASAGEVSKHRYSINIGKIEISGDMGLSRMMVSIIQQLMVSCRSQDAGLESKNTSASIPRAMNDIDCTFADVCWKFFDTVKGTPVVKGLSVDAEPHLYLSDPEILLRADVKKVQVVYNPAGTTSSINVSAGKFSFGYCSDQILSFDSNLKLRESTRDILAPTDRDIVLTIRFGDGTSNINLTTLPLHITLDLQRLDETFSWLGGFSSMLDLGNSMMSTVTVVEKKSRTFHPDKPSRAVHFADRLSKRHTRSNPAPSQKMTARIGGLVLDLQGKQADLLFESTAMKLVSREEGLGLQVDRIEVKGPILKDDGKAPEASVKVKIANARVEYLTTPKEVDLTRLLALLSPSNDKSARDDDILLETLLRQRSQGGVVRATIERFDSRVSSLTDLRCLPTLADDLKKLSTVAKYLPEDDRPGVLILGLIKGFHVGVDLSSNFGSATLDCRNMEMAHISFPSLVALGIDTIQVHREGIEELLGDAFPPNLGTESRLPMVMIRFIGNEMEPTAKIRLNQLRIEYHVSTIMAALGLNEGSTGEAVVAEMVNSVILATSHRTSDLSSPKSFKQTPIPSETSAAGVKTLRFDVAIKDSIIGLNPRDSPAKGLLVLTDATFLGVMPSDEEASATLEIRKASIMVIDDVRRVDSTNEEATSYKSTPERKQMDFLSHIGYVAVGLISAAKATVKVIRESDDRSRAIEIDIRDIFIILETCADSTDTLQDIINRLKPPMPPSTELKYRTEVIPVEDMLASLTGNGFEATESDSEDNGIALGLDEGDMVDDEVPQNLEFVSSFYAPEPNSVYDGIADSMLEENLESLARSPAIRTIGDKNVVQSFQDQTQIAPGASSLNFQEDHFGNSSTMEGKTHRQDNHSTTHRLNSNFKIDRAPLQVRMRDVHIIWNLFDGYDWQSTRDTISQAIEDIQSKATERLSRKEKRKSYDAEDEDESVIGDFLFNSIYIGVPANRDPKHLATQVSRNLDDLISESESHATSTSTSSPSRQGQAIHSKGKRLRLKRSQYHKMTFELKGISADIIVFPPDSGETQSSIDIRIQDLDIFDHVPTSTWKKFASYMYDAGERESGTSMVRLEILNVKPVPNLAASELNVKVSILPLRLHVDQDALDFMTRFFEFKPKDTPSDAHVSDAPFFQRVEVNAVEVKLDFKPKRVDYAGIRSGHTTEFMNFFILDRADMVLRHVIIYGVSGFAKIGKTLNDIWMPDIKRNQLPGILAGLAPVRSLVNVGGGVRDLVVVPIREYRKDGRVMRSFQKGAMAFAKTTTSELVKLGAKLALGTQTVLEGVEDILTQPSVGQSDVSGGWEDAELDEDEKKHISIYADQPVGVVQGLRGAYSSLERDLLTAKDAIVAMPGEVLESGTPGGAAKAVLRGAPTVILRPAMGVSKAVGQTLMGATNSLDPGNRRRIEDKYKKH